MQVAEFLLLLVLALGISRVAFGIGPGGTAYAAVLTAGLSILVLGSLTTGWRWQMYPAILGLALLAPVSLWKRTGSRALRLFGTVALASTGALSAFLAIQLPLIALPEPDGPYGVGTFDYSLTDFSRVEQYDTDRHRELYVEVWYPADPSRLNEYPASTLYKELYESGGDWISHLSGYLRNVETHSFANAPVAGSGSIKFPVLLFNHGQASFTSQNQLLMEHLASHGYVIFSIGHPYDSLKVNLSGLRVVHRTGALPSDIELDFAGISGSQLMSKVLSLSNNDYREFSRVLGLVKRLGDELDSATSALAYENALESTLTSEELKPYADVVNARDVEGYLLFTTQFQDTKIRHWVEDTQYIADTLLDTPYPLDGFHQVLETESLGVFGMSFGGAVAGEFCKLDTRCKAGANFDGTQFGANWKAPLQAPFLMLYTSESTGMNDFAYPPGGAEFRQLTIQGTKHFDFTDVSFSLPFMKTIGLSGSIDKKRMVMLLNNLQLSFFDHYLKGVPVADDLLERFPEAGCVSTVARQANCRSDG